MNARQAFTIVQERKKLQAQLGNGGSGFKVRCVVAVARNILLQGNYSFNGRNCNPKAKYIGAGVYEVSLEEPNRPDNNR